MPLRHAALSTRKAVFARSAVVSAFAGLSESNCSGAHLEEALECRDELLASFARKAVTLGGDGLPDDGQRLDAFAHSLLADVGRRRAEAGSGRNTELAGRLAAVEGKLSSLDCVACAGALGAPCGTARHHHVVAGGGHCIAELKDVFGFAAALGRTLYDDAWGGSGDRPSIRVDLQLSTASFDLTSLAGEGPRLRAQTIFEAAGQHISIVNVDLDGHGYGDVERSALPYMIAHEVVAHGYFDVMAGSQRNQRGPYDFWSEGWMDCAALAMLLDALGLAQMGQALAPAHLIGNQAVIDQSLRSHAARYRPANHRAAGRIAPLRLARGRYEGMARRLKAALGSQAFDPMRTVHLAMAVINATGAREAVTGAFNARAAIFDISARQGLPFTDPERQMYESLASFVEHHDSDRLIRELV